MPPIISEVPISTTEASKHAESEVSNPKLNGETNGTTNGIEKANLESQERVAIGRADQVWNKAKRRYELFKSRKPKSHVKFNKYCVFVRTVLNEDGSVCSRDIELQGPKLRKAIVDLNKGVAGFSVDDSSPKVNPKFLFYAFPGLCLKLEQARKQKLRDQELVFELEAGKQFIEEEYQATFASLKLLLPKSEIDFKYLWTIFKPDTIAVTADALGHPRAIMVRSSDYVQTQCGTILRLTYQSVDSDGLNVGWVRNQTTAIGEWIGVRPIFSLPAWPLEMHPDATSLRQTFLTSGRLAMKRHNRQLVSYEGHALTPKGNKFNSHGRVMLDPETYKRTQPDHRVVPDVDPIPAKDLDDKKLMLMSTILYGFALGSRRWGSYSVFQTSDVVWNPDIFSKLVLDPEQKSFIHDLVQSHDSKDQNSFDDIVQGKGKGLIGLLTGSPGVGKTLTAEAIAEVQHRPLYVVSSGELGEVPSTIHPALTAILELVECWQAVLLIDEADVFLAERDSVNLTRNAVTSIFLRELEYYQGVMILTTNRGLSIDGAFQSRIHFSLEYPSLNAASRAAIWKNFVDRARGHPSLKIDISDADIERMSKLDLNGRQIKNSMSVTQAVAVKRGTTLTADSIMAAMKFSQFINTS